MCSDEEDLYLVTFWREVGLTNAEIQAMRKQATVMDDYRKLLRRLAQLKQIPTHLRTGAEETELMQLEFARALENTQVGAHPQVENLDYLTAMQKLEAYQATQSAEAVSKYRQKQESLITTIQQTELPST